MLEGFLGLVQSKDDEQRPLTWHLRLGQSGNKSHVLDTTVCALGETSRI